MEANRLREGSGEGSGSDGDLGGEGRRSWTTGLGVPLVLDKIWYAVFLRAPRALVPIPALLGDVLALSLYTRAMGENPFKGRDIEGIPNGR